METIQIFDVVLSIVSLIVTGVLVPYIVQKKKNDELLEILENVEIAVQAAEQIYSKHGEGYIKKKFVQDFIRRSNLDLSNDELDKMIESAVYEMNQWKKSLR